MHPYLIDFGTATLPFLGDVRVALPSYGLLVALAMVIGWGWFVRNAARDGIDREVASNVVFWAVISGIVGGKLGLVLVEPKEFLTHPSRFVSFEFLSSAGVIWTGVLGGVGAMILLSRSYKLPLTTVLDAAAIPLPVAQAIGRVGCLLAGCCFGLPTTLPWGLQYHNPEGNQRTGVPLDIPLHPSPLYEAGWNLLVVLPLLLWMRSRRRTHGELILTYLVVYAVGRFFIERSRGDAVRGVFAFGLSTSQMISAAMIVIAATLWWVLRRRSATNVAEPPSA